MRPGVRNPAFAPHENQPSPHTIGCRCPTLRVRGSNRFQHGQRRRRVLTKKIPETAWAAELHRFSSRNAGRVTTLEVDRLNFQPGPNDAFPLRGISYDAHDDRVLITLGRNSAGLMHTIARATGIYL